MLPIKIKNLSHHPLPEYATAGSSGMDIRAFLFSSVSIMPMERVIINTGLFVEIPEGYELQVRPRSGLAIKHGITCLNTPGTIDSDYRGEIKVILINLSNEPFIVEDGERIAQIVAQKVEQVSWVSGQNLSITDRNEGGFGHTGTI